MPVLSPFGSLAPSGGWRPVLLPCRLICTHRWQFSFSCRPLVALVLQRLLCFIVIHIFAFMPCLLGTAYLLHLLVSFQSSPMVSTLLYLPRGEVWRIRALVMRPRDGVDFKFAMYDGVLGWRAWRVTSKRRWSIINANGACAIDVKIFRTTVLSASPHFLFELLCVCCY